MIKYNKVYPITNENLTSYHDLYHFDNARVLSVLGSGDQFFTSLLYGAKDVEVYDINMHTWYYFVLKFTALKVLSYEDYFEFFITHKLQNMSIYNKIALYLPDGIRVFFIKFMKENYLLNKLIFTSPLYEGPKCYNDSKFIPYFDKEEYYRLQGILYKQKLPRFYNCNISDLINNINGCYDLMLCSNIPAYTHTPVPEYKDFLNKLKIGEFQAHYLWNDKKPHQAFLDEGFTATIVDPVNPSEDVEHNLVLSYKKIN